MGAAGVLKELSGLAGNCVGISDQPRSAVAFALETLFASHSEDRTERPTTGDDNYVLFGSGLEVIEAAMDFVQPGGPAIEAIDLIDELARLIPERLYGRS